MILFARGSNYNKGYSPFLLLQNPYKFNKGYSSLSLLIIKQCDKQQN